MKLIKNNFSKGKIMKQTNLKFLSSVFLLFALALCALAIDLFLPPSVLATDYNSGDMSFCGSEPPTNVACGGTCCEHSNCAGGGGQDCKFCDLQKTCSASACGISCGDKAACALR
ncbi:MAG: hypothetical protein LBE20_04720 [Deltaproteobacteria bacterium]|jgi:hypothetical protein|nr:hypothetical protein [Deltaproteobacteria bacterium]